MKHCSDHMHPDRFFTGFCVCAQALITVSNHVASLDDPLATAALLPAGALLRPSTLRWTLCATDRCFTSPAASAFFRTAKVRVLTGSIG